MISVGSRDGRKGLGLGFGAAGSEMEETELEEGEACSYHNDDYSTIDPDVALSYIDVKIQDVLGHFQKDFEGGVSAENLGAKFGGYGSFLPTYQRSPVLSHPRTPAKFHHSNTPRSPNNLHPEGGRHNTIVPSSASLLVRHEQASETTASLPLLRAPVNDTVKRDVGVLFSHCAEESTPGSELGKNCAQPSDQKSLKVRIKVGSDNLSTRNNAEIYSGLGLDISPASSLDDIHSDSEGFPLEPQDGPDESPTSILQIMTSFPVHGNLLLSPLSDDLFCLTEKEKSLGDNKPSFLRKGGKESSNGPDSGGSEDKVLGGKKPRSLEKNAYSVVLKNLNDKDTQNGTGIVLKKETDTESLDCEELVASTSKLLLLSNSYSNVLESTKGTARAVDDSRVADKIKEESLEAVSTQEISLFQKPGGKTASASKVWEDKKADFNGEILAYPRKDGNIRGGKADVSAKADSSVSKGRKAQNAEPVDPLEQKASKKSTSSEEDDMQLPSGKENSSSGGKLKSKGSQSHDAQGAEVPKDSSRIDSSFVPKNRKSTHANYYLCKSEMEDSKLQKDNGKAINTYKDFFGDIELEQGDNDADSAETLSFGGPKDFEAVEKSTVASDSMSKEILNGKKMEKPLVSDAYPKGALNAAPVAGNGSISDAVPGTSGPVVKEDWVACDKCQKWRLLPLGTNPDSLPEKWLCSMLNWLPGMNRCSVSEDETTKALIALYHVPAPVNPNNQQGHPGGVLPGLSMADASHFNQNCQIFGLHAVPSGGKKKNGIKDESDPLSLVGPAQFSNSTKKNVQAAVKCRSLNGVNQSPPGNEIETMHLSKSSLVEKRRHKPKEKNKLREQHSDGGEIRSSKIKSKMDNGQDCFRISKKIKIEGMHCSNPERMPDHDAPVGKLGPSSSSGLSVNASMKDSHKYDDRSSKEGKCEANDSSKGHHRNPKDQGQATPDDGSLDMKKLADKDLVARKRKMNEGQDTLVYIPSTLSGHHRHGRRDYLEQTSENVHRKEKKARVSKSEGKETSASKSSGGAAKKGRRTKDQQLGPDLACSLTQRSLDATDSSRRDLGSVHSQAATSSSSKVSGSRKSITNMHEMKSSPVESVSSSPLRFLNPDRSTVTRSLQAKDDFGEAGLFGTGTPRRCSAGDDERGSNRSMTVRKDETSVTHRESLESVLDFEERDRGHLAGSEAEIEIVHSAEFDNSHFASGGTDTFGNGTPYPSKPQASDQSCDEERGNDKQCPANVSRSRKSGKGSSSRSQVKNGSYKPELDKGKVRTINSGNESIDHAASYGEKSRAGRNGVQEKFGAIWGNESIDHAASDKVVGGNKESAGKVASERSKSESQLKSGEIGSLDVKVEALSSKDQMQNLRLDCDERSSKAYLSDKTDRTEVCGRGKSHPLPPSGRGQNETLTQSIPLNPGCQNENGGNSSLHDASEARSKKDASEGDALKAPKQNWKSENQNGNELTRSKHPTINGHKVRDADAPSPARRDSSNPVTNAVKEAKDLKHLADRLKNSGSSAESTGLYFQAALKFLRGASLLESSNGESAKQGEMIQSMKMYSSTAKLCEFCAHEYEKSKDMAAAALAYKCMEVAYMRVIYSSRTSASRDRHDLQTALQIVPLGESPSSSASDVDNLNNPATLDKVPLAKGVSSPQVAGNHVIATRNRPSFARLLNFTQDVNHAMEASRKSRMAFIAANLRKEEAQYREGITSVKTALDFNFQDVEGLLHLVRLAMEAIGR